jgi:hypothetical protein
LLLPEITFEEVKHGHEKESPSETDGGRIVAETFVRILKRDASSYLNAGGSTPILPSSTPGNFTVADLVAFAGVTQP